MNHNPHNFKVGDKVMLDEQHKVLITGFTPQQLFAQITDDFQQLNGEPWEVMTNRLTPISDLGLTDQKEAKEVTWDEVRDEFMDNISHATDPEDYFREFIEYVKSQGYKITKN